MALDPAHVAWMRQWRQAAPALADERRARLASLTDEQGLRAAEAVLSLVTPAAVPLARRTHSGLVEQQALFHARPGR